MGLGPAVQSQTVAIKPPGQRGVVMEVRRIGNFLEGNPRLSEGWISLPKTFFATKVRQTGIDAHPGARRYQQGIGMRDVFSGYGKFSGVHFFLDGKCLSYSKQPLQPPKDAG